MLTAEAKEKLKALDLKAFLFDMDGVLYDSMPHHAKAWIHAFEQEGVKFDEYNVYLREGMTGNSTVQEVFQSQLGRMATEDDCQRIYRNKSDFFNALGPAKVMAYVSDVLFEIKNAGLDVFLVTGSGQCSLLSKLNTSFPCVFKTGNMVTAFDVSKGKPDPEPYLMALKKGGLKANQAIVVENAPLGVRAGVGAGIFTIAVNTGILKDEDLEKHGCGVLYHSMFELLQELPQIISMAKKDETTNF